MIADIALPIPVGKSFSYTVPDELTPYIFTLSRVLVPFRYKEAAGVVVAIHDGDGAGLKSIAGVLDFFPLVDEELAALVEWSSSFYVTPPGLVFKYALPPVSDLQRFLVTGTADNSLADMNGLPLRKAVRKFGDSRILRLYSQKELSLHDTLTNGDFRAMLPHTGREHGGEKTLLVDSVENRLKYYNTLISDHLGGGGNVLILLPDYYAAGAWFTKRLKEIYGPRLLWFASGVPVKERMETYFKVRREGGYVVLGNKNSVFLPIRDLSLIIVERHDDDEYKNEEGFKFNPVRVAVERASLHSASIVLGSGACALDMIHLARARGFTVTCNEWLASGGYTEKLARVGSRSAGEILDNISRYAGEPAVSGVRIAVYTPRKDYGAYLKCHVCKETFTCPDCGGPLNYDRDRDIMSCSGCAGEFPYQGACPHCGSNMIGFSRIGALFVEEHIRRTAPGLNVVRITGDSLKKEISAVRKLSTKEGVVLVGTQSLSKLYGFHVDKLILAGWEELRKMGGFRSDEKTHQVIANLIDALTPAEILCHSGKREPADPGEYLHISAFCAKELKRRREADFPPFVRVFLVQARKKTAASADAVLKKIRQIISEEGLDGALFGTLPFKKPPFHMWKVILKGNEHLMGKAFRRFYDIPGVEIEADPNNF